MRNGRVSRTAIKLARVQAYLGHDPKIAPLLADGATAEATALALWASAGIAAAGMLPVLLVPGARPRPGERPVQAAASAPPASSCRSGFGPLSWPLAAGSRSTSSITAISAASP